MSVNSIDVDSDNWCIDIMGIVSGDAILAQLYVLVEAEVSHH